MNNSYYQFNNQWRFNMNLRCYASPEWKNTLICLENYQYLTSSYFYLMPIFSNIPFKEIYNALTLQTFKIFALHTRCNWIDFQLQYTWHVCKFPLTYKWKKNTIYRHTRTTFTYYENGYCVCVCVWRWSGYA